MFNIPEWLGNLNELICYFLKHSFMRNTSNSRNPVTCRTNNSRVNSWGNSVIFFYPSALPLKHIRTKPAVCEGQGRGEGKTPWYAAWAPGRDFIQEFKKWSSQIKAIDRKYWGFYREIFCLSLCLKTEELAYFSSRKAETAVRFNLTNWTEDVLI